MTNTLHGSLKSVISQLGYFQDHLINEIFYRDGDGSTREHHIRLRECALIANGSVQVTPKIPHPRDHYNRAVNFV